MRPRTRLAALLLPLALLASTGPDAPVADAAQRGDAEAVRRLLRQGADVNVPQGDGMTALHWAADRGDADLAGVLLYAGADVRAGTRIGGYTPLHVAAEAARAGVVRVLLEAGADPDAATTTSGSTPLHLAAGSGDPEVVRLLVDAGADVHRTERAWGQTPLTFAAAANRAGAVRVLLAAGADPNATARSVNTAEMAEADELADRRIGEMLDAFREKEGGGPGWQPSPAQVQAAIEAAREVQRRWPDVPRETEAEDDGYGEDPDDAEGEDEAEGEGEADEAAGADAEAAGGGEEEGAAAEEDEPEPLSYPELVKGWGGLAPLHHAARQGHVEAALALLEGGADVDLPSGGDGTTPLLIAAINGQLDLALLLLERGADPRIANAAGTTPLYGVLDRQWAPRASYAHPVEHQQQRADYLQVMEALLEAGADPNARLETHLWYMEYTFSRIGVDTRGATAFFRAAHALDVPAMRLLVRYGADPSIPTRRPPGEIRWGAQVPADVEDLSGLPPVPVDGPGVHPLHAAAGFGGRWVTVAGNAWRHAPDGWMPAVRYLVDELGADVNARDFMGYNAVHHAAGRGDDEMIRFLVERGADPAAVARSGQTAVDMANGPVSLGSAPFPETIALLESLGVKGTYDCAYC